MKKNLAATILNFAMVGCASAPILDPIEDSISAASAPICRSADFSGCCSWNEGVFDYKTGTCGNEISSQRCDAKWDISLQGRCSGKGGVFRVTANGTVLCAKGGESTPRIPKCKPL